MQKSLLLFVFSVALTTSAIAQSYGDTARAHAAAHHPESVNRDPKMQLGYIDTDVVTRQEFLDNLQVGLHLVGPYATSMKVEEFILSYLPKGGEYIPGKKIKGGKFPYSEFTKTNLQSLKSGDRIFIEGIQVMTSDGIIRKINSLSFRIQ